MDESQPVSPVPEPIEPPRGFSKVKLDDKGRLKLPADFLAFFRSVSDKKMYVTSLDRRIGQLYPIDLWKATEKFFEEFSEDPDAVDMIKFNADDLGGDTEIDSQGRVLLKGELRRELGLDGELYLQVVNGHVDILTSAIVEERRVKAKADSEAKLKILRKAGLK